MVRDNFDFSFVPFWLDTDELKMALLARKVSGATNKQASGKENKPDPGSSSFVREVLLILPTRPFLHYL